MNRPFHGGIILLLLLPESFRINFLIRHLHISHNAPYLLPKILHNLCFSFLLGITARESENNAHAKFWGANKVHIWEMCKWRLKIWTFLFKPHRDLQI